jgi:HlyD family secretion protein
MQEELTVRNEKNRLVGRFQPFRPLGLALALTAVSLGAVACNRGETQEVKAVPDLAPVQRVDMEIQAEASGQIEPIRIVEVKSKVSGELLQMGVQTGDLVQQGALIAAVDPRDVRNTFEQAQADVELARARVATTAAAHRRARELSQAGIVSAQDLETAQLEEVNARAQLLKAETNLTLAREKTGDVTIRSPITGTVIEKTVEQGQIIASASANVSGGTTLVKMADLATVRARALVDETDIGRIQPGQEAVVTVEAYPGRNFRGHVEKIEPQAVVDQNVTMFPVLVELRNPDGLLKPGMNAEVSIQIADRTGVLSVPNGAVVSLREAPTAGVVLGLEEQQIRAQLAKLREERQRTRGDRGGDGESSAGAPADGPAVQVTEQGGGNRGEGRGPRGEGGFRRGAGAGAAEEGQAQAAFAGGSTRPGVVFVQTPQGPEPRIVMLGLSDWDNTEVLRGVEEGTSVYLISVARLQQQQQQQAERMRQRGGAGMLGGGQQRGGGTGGGQRGGGGR